MTDRAAFAARVGLDASSTTLLEALTHSSYAVERGGTSNERLEFLGDAVLDLVVSEEIFHRYRQRDEGKLSVLRSRVVNETSLASAARGLELSGQLRVGKGVIKERGHESDSLLADAFEAIVAALYLDRGLAAASDFALAHLADTIDRAASAASALDPKTRLLQAARRQGWDDPVYDVTSTGTDQAPAFTAAVTLRGATVSGEGRTKKAAQLAAATKWWEEHGDA